MKRILLATVAAMIAPRAFMSDMCETVLIKGKGGVPLRVNKSDYDADQAEGGTKSMTLHDDNDKADQAAPTGEVKTFAQLGIEPVAAPSAPDFSAGGTVAPAVIDPRKDAAAPAAPSPNQRLVTKEGEGKKARYFIVDGTGTKLEGPGIDKDGYETDQAAWAAVVALPDAGNTGA